METWRLGGEYVEKLRHRHGDMETWRHGDMKTWRHGDMKIWTWRHGNGNMDMTIS
jgi:hypothetical protein